MNLHEFVQKYPSAAMHLKSGKDFTYRYYKNPNSEVTLVLLTGGIGLSDLFYLHFERFAKDFSVMTFDYQMQFSDNKEFAAATAELLSKLNVKAWLVGQSLGGVVAQIIAKNHPEVVEGLVLSNTCSLAKDMGDEAYRHVMNMVENEEKSKKMMKFIPFGLFKRLMKAAVMKKLADDLTAEQKSLMEGLCDAMVQLLTKPYQLHMADFLIDVKNHLCMTRRDFEQWNGKVLLILSADDNTFNQACKDSLIALMPDPTVVTNILGGHLALLVKLDIYADTVSGFITGHELPVNTHQAPQ